MEQRTQSGRKEIFAGTIRIERLITNFCNIWPGFKAAWEEIGRKKMIANIIINNAPEQFSRYIVVRFVKEDHSIWFYGTYEDKDRAEEAIKEINNAFMIEDISEEILKELEEAKDNYPERHGFYGGITTAKEIVKKHLVEEQG